MLIATLEITLPPAPSQVFPQKERALAVEGALTTVPASVPLDMKTIDLDCDPTKPLTIRLREVPTVGQVSDECVLTVTPANWIKANAADPNAFQFAIKGIRTEPDPAPAAEPAPAQ